MSESNLINNVIKNLKPRRVLIQRLEVMCAVGIPDCCYAMEDLPGAGFIEFKYLKDYPKRLKTPVRIDHFTPQQRAWMQMYGPFIQRVFLLLQISTTFLLFPWTTIKPIGNLNRVDLITLAEEEGGYWGGRINYDELVKHLRRNHA